MTTPTECRRRIARGGWAEDRLLQRCAIPIGPRNTWSNLGYAAVGLLVAWHARTGIALVFGAAMLALAVGSGLYHAWKTPRMNDLDWFGMYAVMSVLVLHGWLPRADGLALGAVAIGGTAGVLFGMQRYHYDWHMLGLFLLAWLRATPQSLVALAAFGSMLLAYGCWWVDRHTPTRWRWGHACWHLLAAMALGLTFLAQGD